MSESDIAFLKSLPFDGRRRVLQKEELETAHRLHMEKLCFLVRDVWPNMSASITFEGRKALARVS